ncbi:MAG: hypothetical protein IT422_00180 [Pirellulaceae bacterium]|jgi:hypothetical protein|nr:hypothetical protein [Pirellulaceae bacterium]
MRVDRFDSNGKDQTAAMREAMRDTPLLTIRLLFNELAHRNQIRRELARRALVAIGGPVVIRALVCELGSHTREARWEAAKALDEIEDIEIKGR